MLGFFAKRGVLSYCLYPFSLLFLLIIRVRQCVIKPKRFKQFTICVGNATVGGGGKTPSSLALGKLLTNMHYQYSYLSKGYKGSITAPTIVDLAKHSVAETGDEVRLLAKQSQAFIAKKRHEAIELLNKNAANIIILDDGFQNLYIKCDLYVLVVDENYAFGNELLMPAGPLRDTIKWHIDKADCIFVIKKFDGQKNEDLRTVFGNKPVFYLKTVLDSEIDFAQNYLAFSALANNAKFHNFLKQIGVRVSNTICYKDHHKYSNEDFEQIKAIAKAQNLAVITTEKDAVKIDDKILSDYVICKISLEFEDKNTFEEFIKLKLK